MEQANILSGATSADIETTVIQPGYMGFLKTMSEVWQYRELFFFLVWRDISVRYKQTVLGISWVVFQPLVAMLIFTLVFNRLASIQSGDIPYPLFVMAGHIPWIFFASSLNRAGESLVINTKLITKIYFPRIIIPAAAALAALVDFIIALLVLAGLMVYFNHTPGIAVLALPLLTILTFALAVSFGMLFSTANVRYRDVKYLLGFVVQMWMFVTPVVYPYTLMVEKYPKLAMAALINPMVGVIEGFRWCLLGGPFPGTPLAFSGLLTLAMLIIAQSYFRRVERAFADVV